MKRNVFALAFGLILMLPACLQAQASLPNIIIVITDDQGKNDLACEGNPYVKTPNIDQFHGDAIRLTNFHVSTTCAPTRGALLSGRHTNKVNTFHTIAGRSLLLEDELLLPEVLAQNGYRTGMFGKWHLGDNYPYRPSDRGFQETVWHKAGGIPQSPDYWGNTYFSDTYWHNDRLQKYEGYCTDIFFQEALSFIEKNKDQPFFAYISTNAPHGPLNCPEEYMDMYANQEGLNDNLQRLYGMITNLDDNFALLEQKLKELGLQENTILIFMTDNGTAYGVKGYDAGMRGHKGSVYEGGHRVPFYLRWPAGKFNGGRDIEQLTAHIDVLPTLVDMLNLRYKPTKKIDGKSLLPLLKDEDTAWPNRILMVDTQRKLNLSKYKDYSVMDEDWRLVNGNELYAIKKDLKQENNLIDQHPEVAARLRQGYESWWKSIEAENANETYAYIKVGTPHENPSLLCAHDMLTGKLGKGWHQSGIAQPEPASGIWKVQVMAGGMYRFSLRRFPQESNLAINATFPAAPKPRRLQQALPASTKDNFREAYLYIGPYTKTKAIEATDEAVVFECELPPGKFDMEARLIDENGAIYPAFYVDIEKL